MTLVVLSEYSAQLPPSASTTDLKIVTEAARLTGFPVYYIPADFEQCETAENALAHLPHWGEEIAGLWVGYIPSPERYEAIYQAALKKGLRLLNTPAQHQLAMEFDQFYPLLTNLTPKSEIISTVEEGVRASTKLGFPLFVKGTVQSRKHQGWEACVAYNQEELVKLTTTLLNLKSRSRGRVILRELLNLRYKRKSGGNFPLGREFRVRLYNQEVVVWGYYWEGQDELASLSFEEEQEVLELARLAARQLNVPYLAVDIGQTEDGRWWVIEVSDAQFTGLSHTPALTLWHKLEQAVEVAKRRN